MSNYPDKQTLVEYIGRVSLFAKAERSILERLAEKTKIVLYKGGDTVIRKGDEGKTMYIIFSGSLKVHDGEHIVAQLKEGDFFGEFSLLDGEPRSMSVSTISTSVLGSIEREDFYEVLEQFPGITKDIISIYNRRLRNQNDRLVNEFRTREDQLKELVRIRTKELEDKNSELELAMDRLQKSQMQLIQSEKLASLGKLTAGIAHEIQNPLNFVNNFSVLSVDLIRELTESKTDEEREEIIFELKNNIERILHNGSRANMIVKSMLEHSRTGKGERQPVNINQLCEEYIKISYHGTLSKYPEFECTIEKNYATNIQPYEMIPQEMSKAIWNILNNAFYAVKEKSKNVFTAGTYMPLITLTTESDEKEIRISIRDNGTGISDEIKDKIFNPFFTTKPTGEGTGLGLSLTYDIIKAHGGDITFISKPEEGSEFTITLQNLN